MVGNGYNGSCMVFKEIYLEEIFSQRLVSRVEGYKRVTVNDRLWDRFPFELFNIFICSPIYNVFATVIDLILTR